MHKNFKNELLFRSTCDNGFTLVELMVVVAIVAILSAVAIPAYINHVNRSRQSEAAALLMTARMEMEEFYTDNGHYAATIQCLPSMVATANTSCLASCPNCAAVTAHPKLYTYFVETSSATPLYYRIAATRNIYSWAQTDKLTISSGTDTPTVLNTNALSFSVFKWLFQ